MSHGLSDLFSQVQVLHVLHGWKAWMDEERGRRRARPDGPWLGRAA